MPNKKSNIKELEKSVYAGIVRVLSNARRKSLSVFMQRANA